MNSPTTSYAAYIGIDWASRSHAIALQETRSDTIEESVLPANPNAVDQWIRDLEKRFKGQRIALCVELSRGALVAQLSQFDFIDLYPLNPVTSARFRKAFKPSGTKDDPSDARTHLTIVRQHREALNLWKAKSPHDHRLELLSHHRRKLVEQQVSVRNTLMSKLRDYFPLALEVAGADLASRLSCAFLRKWPSLGALKRSRPETIRRFYYAHGSRRGDVIEGRLRAIKEAKAVSDDPSYVEPHAIYVLALVAQLEELAKGIANLESEIEQAYANHPDHQIWSSFPGAGKVLAPRLALAWTSDRGRFGSANEMQIYSGVAPVRNASGKRETVFRRYHRPLFLHQSFWEYAKHSTHHCQWAKDM